MQAQADTAVAAQPATPPNFDVPADACDTHAHIFGDAQEFPFFAGRVYTPPPALPAEMTALHQALRVRRVVIVTPSVYGTDNSATLYGIKTRGADARGVAVIDQAASERELDALAAAGVCGIRLNLATDGQNDPALGRKRLAAMLPRASVRNWHVQIFTNLKVIAGIKDLIAVALVPVVLDHFGGARAALGPAQPGFADLIELVRSGKAYVKISGAYRASGAAPDYADTAPLAKALIAANPRRVIWGTDWPHTNSATPPGRKATNVTPFLAIDDGKLMNQLPVWAPDAAIRKAILVDNPARLYGFG